MRNCIYVNHATSPDSLFLCRNHKYLVYFFRKVLDITNESNYDKKWKTYRSKKPFVKMPGRPVFGKEVKDPSAIYEFFNNYPKITNWPVGSSVAFSVKLEGVQKAKIHDSLEFAAQMWDQTDWETVLDISKLDKQESGKITDEQVHLNKCCPKVDDEKDEAGLFEDLEIKHIDFVQEIDSTDEFLAKMPQSSGTLEPLKGRNDLKIELEEVFRSDTNWNVEMDDENAAVVREKKTGKEVKKLIEAKISFSANREIFINDISEPNIESLVKEGKKNPQIVLGTHGTGKYFSSGICQL